MNLYLQKTINQSARLKGNHRYKLADLIRSLKISQMSFLTIKKSFFSHQTQQVIDNLHGNEGGPMIRVININMGPIIIILIVY